MTLLNQHVTEYLNYYSKLKTSPGYAVLLKGKWGCGKTWFIKKYRDEINDDCEGKQKNRCKCLYVSLYGVTSYGEIEHIFFQQLHPVLSSKGMAITGKILKGLIKTSIKIDIDGDGKSDGSVGSQIPDLNLPEEFLNTDDSILIFDDLERCGINQEDILGYINYFVEYQGLKVIIIANEEAIIDKEKYIVENDSTAVSYKEKKEKIVGKTLEIKSDADSAIDNFINDIDNESLRSSIKDKKSLILDIYSGSSYDNLRHLKQGILDYARLVSSFDNDVQNNTEFISHFIKVFFPLYFEIRSGKFNAEDIKDVNCILANYRNENNEMVNLNKSLKKYNYQESFDLLFSLEFWIDFFEKGLINNEMIENDLGNIKYFSSSHRESWRTLWCYHELDDESFKETISKVEKELDNNDYQDPGVILHIAGMFLDFSHNGIYEGSNDEISKRIMSAISNLPENPLIDFIDFEKFNYTDSYRGLSFQGNELDEFKDIKKQIVNFAKNKKESNLPDEASCLLTTMKTDTDLFWRKVTPGPSIDSVYHNVPILHHIETSDFLRAYTETPPESRRFVFYAIKGRYCESMYCNLLKEELIWLRKIREVFYNYSLANEGKLSSLVVKQRLGDIDESIDCLEKCCQCEQQV